jgi:hypothetical protein
MTRHDMNLPRLQRKHFAQAFLAVLTRKSCITIQIYRTIRQRNDGGDSVNVWSHEVM